MPRQKDPALSPSRPRPLLLLVVVLLLAASALAAGPAAPPAGAGPQAQSAAAPAAGAQLPSGQFKVWLQAPRALAPRYSGKAAAVSALNAGAGRPLALASGDFDQDGVQDLVVGYATASGGALAVYRGNLDAFAPQSKASFDAIGRGQFPDPFLPNARVMDVPGAPDFLATSDFNGDGYLDIAMASRSSGDLLLFFGNGHGLFTQPFTLALPGPVTALAAERLLPGSAPANILVGTGGQKPALLAFTGTHLLMSFPMSAPVTSLAFGNLYRDAAPDTAMVAGGQVMILRGRDLRAAAAGNFNFRLESVGLPLSAVSVDIGSFLFDRGGQRQMAVLSSDGSVHVVAHSTLDARPWSAAESLEHRRLAVQGKSYPLPAVNYGEGWRIAETIPAVASVQPGRAPIMMRTHVSDGGADDIAVLDASTGQMHVVAHNSSDPSGAVAQPVQGELSLNTAAAPVAALRLRVNVDARPGLVVLNQGQAVPTVVMPVPDPTFFVNRTDDPAPTSPIANACNNVSNADTSSSCSLREAVLKANATAGNDTIMLDAQTYTLTRPRAASPAYDATTGTLNINDSVSIVGAGQATTIVRAGATTATGVDMLMAVNEDLPSFTNASASISNLTLQNGQNLGNDSTTIDGDAGCLEFDTGGTGTQTLTLTNVTITNCATTKGEGGGAAFFNSNIGAGGVTISNSIIQNNSAVDARCASCAATGGGIWNAVNSHLTISNSQILNNLATQVSSDNSVAGEGGGIRTTADGPGEAEVFIHATTISGNQAAGLGGGLSVHGNLLIDQSSIISGNSAGSANKVNETDGGGIYADIVFPPDAATLTKVTITGNSAPNGSGGGIFNGDNSGAGGMTIHFSRLAGNSAGTAGSANLANDNTTINATNNWWGTNTPSGTILNSNGGTTTFDPFIVLTHTASPATIRINQSTTLTGDMSKDNHGSGAALAGNLDVIIGLPITFNNPVDGSIPQAQPETLNSSAQATATFNAGGAPGGGAADATVDQQTTTASIVVLAPPTVTKSFNPTTVAINAPSTITFSIDNPNVVAIDVSFTDSLPFPMVVAATPNVTNTCGGTVTATAGLSSISFVNASLPVGTCTVTVDVTVNADGLKTNSVTLVSTAAGNSTTSSASLTVINPPTIAKAFGAATIPLNGTTSLTFTVSNTNVNTTLSGIAFTDSLPAGLVVATPNGLSSTCSGTATAVAGSGSVSLSGASLAPGASCTVSANVQGTTAGVKNNSVQATDTSAGAGNTSNASLTVVSPPTISKAFGAASIPLNGSTSLSFTIDNPNGVGLTGIAFSDTLPAGLIISTPNGLTGTCGGGTITATAGTNTISLSGGTVAAIVSCTFSVNVTGTAAGQQNNTTGAITSTEGGTGATSNTAPIRVVAPPSIAKVFNPSTIALNATTSLTFTITNPAANVDGLTGVAFTDTLPTGLTVANASATVCGGTLTTTAPTGIALSGATIDINSQCQFSVTVTGAASGQYTNTTGSVTSTNGGTGNTASANLTVAEPPTITKSFIPPRIPLNGAPGNLIFHITNPNTNVTLNGIAFTDSLPAGLVVATIPSNNCGGSVTAFGGTSSVSLTGGSIPPGGTCDVGIGVQGTTAGVKNNTVQVTSTEGGTGNTSTANITVVAPPVIIKAFGAASIPLNGSTSLQFTIQNNTTVALSGVAFSDTLPAGLIISTPNGLTGSCGGGTITAIQGTNVISLSGGTIPANDTTSCSFAVNVTGTAAGTQNNTTGNITATFDDGTGTLASITGGTASASLNVVAPPSIAKAFGAPAIPLNGTTSLTFTITNPAANAVAETGVAFTDSLPAGIVVATPNGLTNTCGGTATAVAGSGSISLTGGTIAASSSCTVTVNVTGTASGNFTNTTGNVTSTNGGTGNTASANLTVAQPPSITKTFGAATIPLDGTTSLTFSITNPNTNVNLTGLAFTDNLPAGLVIASTPNLTNTCGGTATAVGGSGSVSLSAGTLAASASCTVSVDVQGTTAGVKNNSVQVTSTEGGTGNTSNASITVIGPPVIIKAFGAASIPLNGSTSLTFTIQNNNTTTLTGIGFSDTLPAGLVISSPNGLTGSCGGGTITATAGTNVISLSGATLAASSSCTFSVNVDGIAAGTQNNTTGNVTSTEGGTGGTASASINVVAPPSIAKVFNPSSIALNATTSLTFTITNPAANAVALTGVAFTDTLPTGLTVANSSSAVCGGTLTTTAPTGISLSGASIAANTQCQFSVTVTGAAAGNYTNTTGNVTSTNGGTGNTASANLTVATPPTITKVFGAASIPLNGTTSLTFSITNPNTNVTLTGLAFTDNLPAGLVIASTPNLSNTCGGTATAVGGSGSVSLTGGTLASSASCTVSVDVQGTTAGVKNNSVQVTSTEAGTGNTSNASITVIGPPVIIKAFGAASIPLNGSTSLTFTIQNNNTTTTLTGIGFSDTLPAGLVISTPNGLTGSCGGGTITATQGTNVISLSGATLAASTSCTFSVDVTGIAAGTQNNTTGNVTSVEGGTGGTASASIDVVAPPVIAKAFNPTGIPVNGTSTLTFTITNPAANAVALTGVAFTDTLPAGLTVANSSSAVCGGTLTTTAPTGIALSGATIAAGGQCQFSVTVTGAVAGQYTNTTGNVSSTNGGTGNTASANLSVAAPPTITKAFGAANIPVTTSTTLSFTIQNPNALPLTGIAFTDTLPPGLVVATPNGLTGSCGAGTITAVAGSGSVSLTGGTLAANASCTFGVNVTATVTGTFNNTTGAISATESGPGATSNTASLTASDFTLAATPASVTVTAGSAAMYTVTVTPNPAPFAQSVTLTVTGLPLNTTGVFAPNPVAGPINAASNSTLTIATSPSAGLIRPAAPFGTRSREQLAMALSLGGFGFLGMVFVGAGGDRRRKRLAWVLLGLVLLGVVAAGCGGAVTPPQHHNGTPPGTYTLTITGTATGQGGATLSHSTTVTLVVQ